MSRMRIESKPPLEAYIRENGDICLKQETSDEDVKVISIQPEYVKKIISWLQILSEEQAHRSASDDFAAVD